MPKFNILLVPRVTTSSQPTLLATHAPLTRFWRPFGSGIIVASLNFCLSWVSDLTDHLSGSFAERAHRTRRETTRSLNGTELCHRGMDLNAASQICPEPELKIKEYHTCVKFIECDGRRIGRLPHGGHGKSHDPGCRTVHGSGLIVCYQYICNNINMDQRHHHQQHGSRSGEGSDEGSDEESGERSDEGSGEEGSGEEGSGDILEWL